MKIINGIEFRTKEEKIKPIERTKNLNLRFSEYNISGSENLAPENFSRRTLTIAPKINRWIQNYRAASLQRFPERETDYTTVANFLMALGMIFIENYEINEKNIQKIETLLENFKELRTFGLLDLYDTIAKEKTTDK